MIAIGERSRVGGRLFFGVTLFVWLIAYGINAADVGDIAGDVSREVAVVSQVRKGAKGVPIIVLEETHTSRAGQIEGAIVMTRLHDKYGLRTIALEGYLKEDKPLATDWFRKAAGKSGTSSRDSVAVRLLQEGEISAAEFMALVFEDIQCHPIEVAAEYEIEQDQTAAVAPIQYLVKLAFPALTESHVPTIQDFQKRIENYSKQGKNKEAAEETKKMLDFVINVEPWTKKTYAELNEAMDQMDGEKVVRVMKSIDDRARSRKIDLTTEEKEAMKGALAFWGKRMQANATMTDATTRLSTQRKAGVVVMIIGAAHTNGVVSRLRAQGCSFAVLTPLSQKNDDERGDIPYDVFVNRKYNQLSVYTDGLAGILNDALTGQKKPKPVVNMPWFRGKSELYLFLDRVSLALADPSRRPPRYGFDDDSLRGEFVAIDPGTIDKVRKEGQDYIILRATLNYQNPMKRKETWFVIQHTLEKRVSLEESLKQALRKVRQEGEPGKMIAKEEIRVPGGVRTSIPFSLNTTMRAYGETKQAAIEAI